MTVQIVGVLACDPANAIHAFVESGSRCLCGQCGQGETIRRVVVPANAEMGRLEVDGRPTLPLWHVTGRGKTRLHGGSRLAIDENIPAVDGLAALKQIQKRHAGAVWFSLAAAYVGRQFILVGANGQGQEETDETP